jgi:hypothetical protein
LDGGAFFATPLFSGLFSAGLAFNLAPVAAFARRAVAQFLHGRADF